MDKGMNRFQLMKETMQHQQQHASPATKSSLSSRYTKGKRCEQTCVLRSCACVWCVRRATTYDVRCACECVRLGSLRTSRGGCTERWRMKFARHLVIDLFTCKLINRKFRSGGRHEGLVLSNLIPSAPPPQETKLLDWNITAVAEQFVLIGMVKGGGGGNRKDLTRLQSILCSNQ